MRLKACLTVAVLGVTTIAAAPVLAGPSCNCYGFGVNGNNTVTFDGKQWPGETVRVWAWPTNRGVNMDASCRYPHSTFPGAPGGPGPTDTTCTVKVGSQQATYSHQTGDFIEGGMGNEYLCLALDQAIYSLGYAIACRPS